LFGFALFGMGVSIGDGIEEFEHLFQSFYDIDQNNTRKTTITINTELKI